VALPTQDRRQQRFRFNSDVLPLYVTGVLFCYNCIMGKINKDWHLKNKMPVKPTQEQRKSWHIEHLKHCDCRQPTPAIQKLIDS